jgi:hypothetical protein
MDQKSLAEKRTDGGGMPSVLSNQMGDVQSAGAVRALQPSGWPPWSAGQTIRRSDPAACEIVSLQRETASNASRRFQDLQRSS